MTKWLTDYWPGILFSAVVHLALVALLLLNWSSAPTPQVNTPRHIQATLVQLDAKTVAKPKDTPTVDQQKAALAEQRKQQAAAEKQRRQREIERERKAREKRVKEQQAREKKAQLEREQALQQQQQAIANELALEKERLLLEEQAQIDEATTQSYSALIAARIEQNWSRPPSARKGMQCELEIRMVPTGHVLDVRVTKSSGNAAFDRSAIQAVNKIERFNEVKDIPTRIFEQYFRTFKLSFNPKDLRL